jgi:two-component sensor histidine kinase
VLKRGNPAARQCYQSALEVQRAPQASTTTGLDLAESYPKHFIQHIESFWAQLTRKFHLLKIANFEVENRFLAYGIAIAIFVIATILRIVLDPFVLPPAPFFTYYTAVLLTAFFCGLWPAVFAVAISGITALYLFLPPRGSFETGFHGATALLAFFTIVALTVAVVVSLRAAIKKIVAQEQETKLLANELQHRTSNLLTVIQSIAQRSLAGDLSLAQGREIFEARLQALARTHSQLTSSKMDAVSLEEIVRSELEAFPSQTKVEGAEILLDYQQAQKFSLAVHELTTNALKYGALSVPTGGVRIAWSVSNNGNGAELKFRWEEHGGPPVVVPTREGFGSTLLKAAFAKTRMDYTPDGFSCEIEANVANSP